MKNCIYILAVLLIGFVGTDSIRAEENPTEFSGWVSDSNCGAEHMKAGGKDCVEKCIRGGASIGHPEWEAQARVFVDEKDKKVWKLTNQDSLKGYEGEHVRIQARVQADPADTIEVIEVSRIE